MENNYINNILKQLTLDEKIGMIHGAGLFRTEGIKRLDIPPFKMADGPLGVRQDFDNNKWIPINHTDDYVTYLPSGNAIASSWNKELAYRYGQILGIETRGRGKDMILAPSINIIRSPLCGRNFEYLSEDPFFITQLAPKMVLGIQESDVACCVKHFAANNQETSRTSVDTIIDPKTLHEVYLPGFKACIEDANALGIMGAYNKINGEKCCHSPYLLNEVLREQWKFQYTVVSDWSGVIDTHEAANTSIDIEMSVTDNFDQYYMANPLKQAIVNGEIEEDTVDQKVRHVLRTMLALKMIGPNRKDRLSGTYNHVMHQQTTRDIANETVVLLKNEGVLPLSKEIETILVIGDNANRIHSNGGGSAEIKALYEISPLMALKSKLGGNCHIEFVEGYYVTDDHLEQQGHWQEDSLEDKQESRNRRNKDIKSKQDMLRQIAVQKAKEHKHVILFVGLNHFYDLEGQDKPFYHLPYEQDKLIQEVLQVNPDAIVSVLSGSSVQMSAWADHAKAILWNSYNGMEGGRAIVDILFGDVTPSGRLTQTFAKQLSDYPSHSIGDFGNTDTVTYTEKNHVGYRHFLHQNIAPQFPFGHGLSYANFLYEDVTFTMQEDFVLITVQLVNSSDVYGKETVQVYVSETNKKTAEKVLIAFEKVTVEAHNTSVVKMVVPTNRIKEYDVEAKKFISKKGAYTLHVGRSVLKIEASHTIVIE